MYNWIYPPGKHQLPACETKILPTCPPAPTAADADAKDWDLEAFVCFVCRGHHPPRPLC